MQSKTFILGLGAAMLTITGCSTMGNHTSASADDINDPRTNMYLPESEPASFPAALAEQDTTGSPLKTVVKTEETFPQFPEKRPATGKKVVIIDPNIPAWAAYDADGNLVKTGRASGGKHYCPDVKRGCKTVSGTFSVYSKKGPECKSSRYPLETNGGAAMPYCMHFYKGYAIHGSYDVPNHNASHGCVRVKPNDAQWLSQSFVNVGTTVIIKPY